MPEFYDLSLFCCLICFSCQPLALRFAKRHHPGVISGDLISPQADSGLIFPIQQQIELSVDWLRQDFIFSCIRITA
jgi:hypothetical protein